MAAIAAARSVLRSSSAARLGAGAKLPKSSPFPFRIPKHNSPNSPFISRLPVEMSYVMESMMPFHTATELPCFLTLLASTIGGPLKMHDCELWGCAAFGGSQ